MSIDNDLLKRVADTLEEYGPSLEKLNSRPSSAPVGPDDITADAHGAVRVLSMADQLEIRSHLKTKSDTELAVMFHQQLRKTGTGIPLDVWAGAANPYAVSDAFATNPDIAKALDSGSGSALIRQDLEPVLQELYVREFPFWDLIQKIPSNGLVHAFNQQTSFGDAQFMPELGTVTDDRSTYQRQTANIAILATRRGVSLKGKFAVQAGGAGFDPEQLEIRGGLRAIAHKMQKTIFQGNASDSGGTADSEEGEFDPNSFDGLRMIYNTTRAGFVDPATNPDTTGNVRRAFDAALMEALNNGGRVDNVVMRPQELSTFNIQQDPNVRYMADIARASVGVNVQQVNTIMGSLGLMTVPGDAIGTYEYDGAGGNGVDDGDDVADIYFNDMSNIAIAYLGSPGPTVLDIPVGVSGQLVHLYIIFIMGGLVVRAPLFGNKIRVKVA